jgi:hypothetical protein
MRTTGSASSWLRPAGSETIDHAWWTVKCNSVKAPIRDVVDFADFEEQLEYLQSNVRRQIRAGTKAKVAVEFWTAPRSQGVCRFVSLPDVITRISTQCLGLTMSPILLNRLTKSVVSRPSPLHSRLIPHGWYSEWSQFLVRITEIARRFPFLIVSDFANCFDTISLSHLHELLRKGDVRKGHADLVCHLMYQCARIERDGQANVGLPQLYDDTAALLANSYLQEFDAAVGAISSDTAYARWMDDIVLGASGEREARKAIAKLSALARRSGLNLNAYKTRIIDSDTIYGKDLNIDLHRKLDELELRFVLQDASTGGGRTQDEFDKLAKSVRCHLYEGSGELLLRRLYRLAALFDSPRMLPFLNHDLVAFPGSAAAMAQYIATITWRPKVIVDTVIRYLTDPANVYQTVEVSLLLGVLRRDLPVSARRELPSLASKILSRRLPTVCDTSIGIAALLLLRCETGRQMTAEFDGLKMHFNTTPSPHAQRYLLTAMACAVSSSRSRRLFETKRIQDHPHLRFLWAFLARHNFCYDQAISNRAEKLSQTRNPHLFAAVAG